MRRRRTYDDWDAIGLEQMQLQVVREHGARLEKGRFAYMAG